MKSTRTGLISVSLLAVLLLSSISLLAAVPSSSSSANVNSLKATFDLKAVFDSKSLPSSQPSPYCSVSGGALLIMCYTPRDIKVAYNYPASLDGSGQTIVIVDAFGSPTVQSDLNTFDHMFGIRATKLQIVCQGGVCPAFNASNSDMLGWSQEIALDTQYSHAMAPAAHIVLFVAKSDDDLTLERAVQSAVTMFPHSIISQSFGDPELDMIYRTCFLTTINPTGNCSEAYVDKVLSVGEAAYAQAASEGTTVFASAGDWGADNSAICLTNPVFSPCRFTRANPAYPSSSPWVTAVGGTQGNPYYLNTTASCSGRTCATGLVKFLNGPFCQLNTSTPTTTPSCIPKGYGGEQVWNEPILPGATGGAPSLIFGVPSYQHGLDLSGRATPDVSYNAAVDGGVFGYWSVIPTQAGFYIFGGTSAGSPQWAAIAALADQLAASQHKGTIGFINPALYQIGNTPKMYQNDFHDIELGNNIVAGSPHNVGFSAHEGWDDASGWGAPNVANLVPDLVSLS